MEMEKTKGSWGEDGVSEASWEAAGRENLKPCDLKSSPPKTRIETILRPNGKHLLRFQKAKNSDWRPANLQSARLK